MLTMILAVSVIAAPTDIGPGHVFSQPVSDEQLSNAVGMGLGTTRLSVLVGDVGATQSQLLGEDQRAGLVNWFADNNVQLLANEALRGD